MRREIKERDRNKCIFCSLLGSSGFPPSQIAHYVGRAQGGLGIAKNGAFVCVKHHMELDNGTYGKDLKEFYRDYLKSRYEDWNEQDLIYNKWG